MSEPSGQSVRAVGTKCPEALRTPQGPLIAGNGQLRMTVVQSPVQVAGRDSFGVIVVNLQHLVALTKIL